jgi:transcriptional regulator with XRE-family HTH domain
MDLGDRLKSERERLGYSQTSFAALAKASKHAQINWEKGIASPNAAALRAWADAGLDVLYLLTGIPKAIGERLRMERVRINWTESDMAQHLGCTLADYVALEQGLRAPGVPEILAIREHEELDAALVLGGASLNRPTWELDGEEQKLMFMYRTTGPWRNVLQAVVAAHDQAAATHDAQQLSAHKAAMTALLSSNE